MQLIDPITGLPISQLGKVKQNNPTLDTFTEGLTRVSTTDYSPRDIQGSYGEYDMPITSDMDFNELRALGQSTPELLGKSLIQGASTAVLGSLEVFSYLLDPSLAVNAFVDSGKQFESNLISTELRKAQDDINELFPIYKTKAAQGESGLLNKLGDGTYWASNASSIATGLSFLIPGFAVAKGLGMVAKALQLSRGATAATTTIGTALINRHGINAMESSSLFDERYKSALQRGLPDYLAKEEAGQAAAEAYKYGYINLLGDILQWNILLRSTGVTNQRLRESIVDTFAKSGRTDLAAVAASAARNKTTSIVDAFKNVSKQGGKENFKNILKSGAEEIVDETSQQFYSNLASYNADIRAGLKTGKERSLFEHVFSEEGKEYLTSDEAFDAALFGFLGGAAFQAVGQQIGSRTMKQEAVTDSQKQIARFEYIQKQLQEIEGGTLNGDQLRVDTATDKIVADLFFNGIDKKEKGAFDAVLKSQDVTNIYEMFNAIEGLTNEELTALGFTPESKEVAKSVKQKMEQLDGIYNKYSQKFYNQELGDVFAIYSTEQEYMNTNNAERLVQASTKVSDMISEPNIVQVLNTVEPEGKTFLDNRRKISALKAVKELAKKEDFSSGLNATRIEKVGAIRDKVISQIDEELAELEEANKTISPQVSNDTKNLYKNLYTDEIHTATRQEYALKYALKEGELLLADFQNTDTLDSIRKAIKSGRQNIMERVDRFFVQRDSKDGEYVKKDDKFYRINFTPTSEKVTLTEVDNQFNEIGDVQEISYGDFYSGAYKRFNPKIMYTPEQYTAKLDELKSALKDKDFTKGIKILNEEIAKSNFNYKEGNDLITKAVSEHVKTIDTIDALAAFKENMSPLFSNTERRTNFENYVDLRMGEIQAQLEEELKALDELIRKREKVKERFKKKIQRLESTIETIQTEINEYDSKLEKVDGRTKLAKELRALRDSLKESIADTKELIQIEENHIKALDKDIEMYTKIQEEHAALGLSPVSTATSILSVLDKQADKVRAKHLFMNGMDLESLQKMKNDGEKTLSQLNSLQTKLTELFDTIDAIVKSNDTVAEGVAKLKKAIDSQALVDEEVTRNTLKKLLTKIISESKKYEYNSIRDLIDTVQPKALLEYDVEKNTIMDKLNQEKEAITSMIDAVNELEGEYTLEQLHTQRIYRTIVKQHKRQQYLQSISRGGIQNSKQYSFDEFVMDNPMRRADQVFNRTAGYSSEILGDTVVYNKDPNQRRFYKFIQDVNFNDENVRSQYQMELLRPQEYGINLDNLDETEYDKDKVIYAVLINNNGEYITENGPVAEFNKDTAIYTSIGTPDWTTNRFAKTFELDYMDSEADLRKLYHDNKSTFEQLQQKHEQKLQKLLDEYKEVVNGYNEQLDLGNSVVVPIYGKYNGITESSVNGRHQQADYTVFGDPADIRFTYVSAQRVTLPDGQLVTNLANESIILYNEKTGNYTKGQRRNLNTTEVESIIDALKLFTFNTVIERKNYVNTKESFFLDEGVSITDFIQRYVYSFDKKRDSSHFEIRYKDKDGKNINGGEMVVKYRELTEVDGKKVYINRVESYPIFAKDPKDDKALLNQLNPALETALRKALPNIPLNLSAFFMGKKMNEVYTHYAIEDGKLVSKQYQTYSDYLVANKVVTINVPVVTDTIRLEDGTVVKEKSLQFHNQGLFLSPVNTNSPVTKEKPTKKVKETGTEDITDVVVDEPTVDVDSDDPFDTMGDEVMNMLKSAQAKAKSKQDTTKPDVTDNMADPNLFSGFRRTRDVVQQTPIRDLMAIATKLSDRMQIPFEILSKRQFNELLTPKERSENYEVLGMFKNGTVYINSELASTETVIHEFVHPFVSAMKEYNPALYEEIKQDLIDEEGYFNDLMKEHATYTDMFTNGELNDRGWEELITRAIGDFADRRYQVYKDVQRSIWEKIIDFITELLNLDVVKASQISPNTTLSDLADLFALGDNYIDAEGISATQTMYSIKPTDPNQIKYAFKAGEIIQDNLTKIQSWESNKSINEITLWNKIQQLGIPKEQIELLKQSEGNTVEEKLMSFLSNYSFTVNIDIVKKILADYETDFSYNGEHYYHDTFDTGNYYKVSNEGVKTTISEEEFFNIQKSITFETNSDSHSDMTVPGGIDYKINVLKTPLITPSIINHLFDKNQIGWFRSDEMVNNAILEPVYAEDTMMFQGNIVEYGDKIGIKTTGGNKTKTRRILELQSDLFQKGRDSKDLITKNEDSSNQLSSDDRNFYYNDEIYSDNFGEKYTKENREGVIDITKEQYEEARKKLNNRFSDKSKSNENQFLQLLNKDNNWVTFFIKSIIQDSAKKGYEKVLFPSGKTVEKIEGFNRITEELENINNNIKKYENIINEKQGENTGNDVAKLDELKKQKEHFLAVQKDTLSTINFYENTVTNILKKQGYNPIVVTDEYGNTWNEIQIVEQYKEPIMFYKSSTKSGKSLSDIGIKPENWYILTPKQQQNLIECN